MPAEPAPAPQPAEEPAQEETAPPAAVTPSPAPETESLDLDAAAEELGARMGQGLDRLRITGDPQVPTPEEVEELKEVAAEGLAEPEHVPDLVGDAAPQGSAATQGSAFPATSILATTDAKVSPAAVNDWRPPGIQGIDVSSHQGNVDWTQQWNMGARFAYVKATEGTYYKNPFYNQQYNGSANKGMVRGAYHFAIPSVGSAAAEANYFVNNGGGWNSGGSTLPPLLDIEYNPYPELGNTCYNMTAQQMVNWVRAFSDTVRARTGRVPMIYTTTDWWQTCTGNSSAFSDHPLHLASYARAPGSTPAGWATYNIWQYSSTGPFVGDSNVFNGSSAALTAFAKGNTPAVAPLFEAKHAATPALGSSTTGIICGLVNGGCYQNFSKGALLYSPASGVQPSLNGGIRDAWRKIGFEKSILGYPTGAETCGLTGGGCYQNFQKGAILWSPATGAQVSKNGSIRDTWKKSGFETGALGYPTGTETCGLAGGGCYQNFQKGAILWSPASGAHISANGVIRDAYRKAGFETGRLGYPTGAETCELRDGGCYQNFQNGAILWSADTGAQISTASAIRDAWAASKFETGPLGYPTGPETCGLRDGGCYQNFQNGAILWSKATGAQVSANGVIREAWRKNGFETGSLGYPTGAETCGLRDGGCYQNFQNGAILWSKATGAQVSSAGAIRDAWRQNGFETGALGYPTGAETCTKTSPMKCTQTFQGGTITWTAARGAVVTGR
ncbi:GH25 family lysozyme [Arthrobacter sp. zg-Y769]|uniref:GH25 family lysozyme n=1 Tax=Arthrobacter sp. zg-Y769 TaxID=2894191 RepID=UPI001E318B5E|nr:GH25 family lysozyme [Arthrobacter sp. zg-Y769]MCC9203587.1 lysozyme M1 [Arthrobacter sp. zg-Y769]